MNVVAAPASELARSSTAATTAAGIWPIGSITAKNAPIATPRATRRRVKLHS
jgi:hypothetical protein